ncbi:flagellar export chaperone FliS [Thalassospira xiamenensis]|uniref:Flagellar protein FliS n=1 Tax=Thalassospira xiamenensis TaxID=220697 RepID=A0A285RNV2_9PROT|nr:flagellar export chaperone FliS [Thalassospira xiamenensis]SOB95399.1 flagellar protein FliS [Thalassospira xiamenensis]
MNEHAARAYGNQQVNTASPAKMVFMLYEKTISCLQEAIYAVEKRDIQARCNANCRAQEIIAHLANTLDMKQGGQIAANLESIYSFSLIRLMDVDRHNNAEAAREVIDLLSPLRDSWARLSEKSESELRQAIQVAQDTQNSSTYKSPPSDTNGSFETDDKPTKPGVSISA